MFLIGEYVERVADREAGIVRAVEVHDGNPVYQVELQRRGVPVEANTVIGDEQAWRRHHRIHAHVERDTQDCDGRYRSGHIDMPNSLERCSAFGDLEFRERVAASVVNLYGTGTLHVTPDGLTWDETTEEGYRHVTVTWCEDDACREGLAYQRDMTAERAGY